MPLKKPIERSERFLAILKGDEKFKEEDSDSNNNLEERLSTENQRLRRIISDLELKVESRERDIRKLESLIDRDRLTGLLNQDAFKAKVVEFISSSQPRKFALGFSDGRFFSEINNRLGHEKGTEVIKNLAVVLTDHVKSGDIIGRIGEFEVESTSDVSRYGGDEFVALIRRIKDCSDLKIIGERCQKIAEESMRSLVGPDFNEHIGLDFGFVCAELVGPLEARKPYAVEHMEKLIQLADAEMYSAKEKAKDTGIPQIQTICVRIEGAQLTICS